MKNKTLPIRIAAVFVSAVLFASASGCGVKKIDVNLVETKKVRVGDIDIGYKTIGRGYPLAMIMGLRGTMDMWDPVVLGELSSRYRVIIFDNRGMGETSTSAKEFSIKLFADDTAGLLDALGIEKAHVLGWSMGTNVAQELALNHSGKVNKLILYAADPGGKEIIQPEAALKLVTDTSASTTPREELNNFLKSLFPEDWIRAHPDPREYFPIPRETSSKENIERQVRAMAAWKGSFDRLNKIKQPTLLITGTKDVIPPPVNSAIMAREIPGAWLAQIKGGGHGLMYQYPKKFSRIVLEFLRD